MLKGAVDFLLSDSKEAALLRRKFVFRVIPMLNPDGVIYGNYRCSLLGVDLNRRWQNPSRFLHPTVFYTKRFMQYFGEVHEIALYCDMHGHSMKKNMFMYANSLKSTQEYGRNTNVLIKLVPKLLAKANKMFSFKESHFRIEPCKLSTARVVVFKELGVINSYTLEASFYGPRTRAQLDNQEPESPTEDNAQMNTLHMESLGRDLCRVLLAFTSQRAFRSKINEIATAIREEMLQPVPPSVALKHFDRKKRRSRTDLSVKVPAYSAENTQRSQYEADMREVRGSEDEEENGVDVRTAIETIANERELPETMGKEDSEGDSGGSDALGSDNDDSKQEYFYRKKKQLSKSRKKTKKEKSGKQEAKPHSCLRHHAGTAHTFCRPKTPFVFGNYPDRKSTTRISKLLKALHSQTPVTTELQNSVQIVPSQYLLAGLRAIESAAPPPKVRIATTAGGLKTPAIRVSLCPSTSALAASKVTTNLSLRVRSSRIVEALCQDPRLRMGSKLALRKLPPASTLSSNQD